MDSGLDEFQSAMEYYGDRNPGIPIPQSTPVYLTGGHPQLNLEFARTLEGNLNRNLFFPDPPLDYPENFPLLQYMVNVGLALKTR